MKTVLFGGAFDPPHRGHKAALSAVLKEIEPDRVIVLPSGVAPHKRLSGGADDEGRLEMCRAAFRDMSDRVIFSDFDLKQEGKCFSYLALRHFRETDPDGTFYLYVGTDQFLVFETWRNFTELLKQATLCVMTRDGDRAALVKKRDEMAAAFGARVILLRESPVIISSTEVRREVAEKGFSDQLDPAVNAIIAQKGYYGSRLTEERGAVLDEVFQALDAGRLTHTLGVERETVRLCRLLSYGPGEEELRRAALLHDLTRRWPEEKQIAFLREAGEEVSEADRLSPAVLHGRSAAILAAQRFGLSPAACDAIRYHTTGRRGMTLAEKILFFADFIEETRRHAVCREARKRFYDQVPESREELLLRLDEAILETLRNTVSHLRETGSPVHPATLETLEEMTQSETKAKQKGKKMTSQEKAERIARILDDKKGRDIKILKVRDQTVITDYFVICGGGSNTQVKALSDEVEFKLREEDGITPERVEGYNGASWILMDYGDVIVHVFDPASREFYKLEKLWAEAEEVPFTAKED